jgi:thioester reductase-like protein
MSYHLLTGATGLLGSYLLRDGLRAGDRMAALVRPKRTVSASQRIDSILPPHKGNGHLGGNGNGRIARPIVLSGDLTQDDLNLDGTSIDWISRNCHSVIHNAASLQFQGPDRSGEPWRTNVEGTRRVLNLCRTVGIRDFHYVSTAYVCGLRSGHVMEDELDVGQEMGNDYERSKLESERMVREATFFDSVTIYRPAIIVGDSQTGETTGYHGFYAVLKLAHTLVSRVELGVTSGAELAALLGLYQDESKHFVPVDWVSAAMTHIRRNPQFHGRTYHLTARQPTRILDMAAVIQEAVERYSPQADPNDPARLDGEWFAQSFRDQMNVYRAYWRDDPQFDQTNTCWAAPHLPCPRVDRDLLMLMARRAIHSRFGRGPKLSPAPCTSVREMSAHATAGAPEEV